MMRRRSHRSRGSLTRLGAPRLGRYAAVLLLWLAGIQCRTSDVAAPQVSKAGDVVWSADVSGAALAPVADSTRAYFGTLDSRVFAVSVSTGKLVWTQTIAVPGGGLLGLSFGSGLALAGDVLVVPNGYVYGFDRATGALRWTFKGTGGSVPGWSFLSTDGTTVYAGGPPLGRLYAIDAATGVARWEMSVATDTIQTTAFSPIVYRDTVFVGVWRQSNPTTGGLAAVDARTGRKLWFTELRASAPGLDGGSIGRATFAGGLVIVAIGDGQIVGLDRATGRVQWTAPQSSATAGLNDYRTVAATANAVVATSSGRAIYGYDALSGAIRWTRQLNETSSIVNADSTTAYVALNSGAVIAVDGATGATRWVWGTLYLTGPPGEDRVLGPPGVAGDFVYIPAVKKSYKLYK